MLTKMDIVALVLDGKPVTGEQIKATVVSNLLAKAEVAMRLGHEPEDCRDKHCLHGGPGERDYHLGHLDTVLGQDWSHLDSR